MCRYDNFPYLIPLLITGLEDEVPAVRARVRSDWERVGEKWLEEEAGRDARIKEMRDFPADKPSHYPENGEMLEDIRC